MTTCGCLLLYTSKSALPFLTQPPIPHISPHLPTPPHLSLSPQGILGLSLGMIPPNETPPLLFSLFDSHPHLPRVFGLQCCAYDPITKMGGDGKLDIGGADARHHRGAPEHVKLVGPALFWGVDLQAVRLVGGFDRIGGSNDLGGSDAVGGSAPPGGEGRSLLHTPPGQSTATDSRGNARHIVDSGTSYLKFPQKTHDALVGALRAAVGAEAPPLGGGFWSGMECAAAGSARLLTRFPEIELEMASETPGGKPVRLRVPPTAYASRQHASDCGFDDDGAGSEYLMLNLGPVDEQTNGILGQPLFEAYYTLHTLPSVPGNSHDADVAAHLSKAAACSHLTLRVSILLCHARDRQALLKAVGSASPQSLDVRAPQRRPSQGRRRMVSLSLPSPPTFPPHPSSGHRRNSRPRRRCLEPCSPRCFS